MIRVGKMVKLYADCLCLCVPFRIGYLYEMNFHKQTYFPEGRTVFELQAPNNVRTNKLGCISYSDLIRKRVEIYQVDIGFFGLKCVANYLSKI